VDYEKEISIVINVKDVFMVAKMWHNKYVTIALALDDHWFAGWLEYEADNLLLTMFSVKHYIK
jgi:hypothetical protein